MRVLADKLGKILIKAKVSQEGYKDTTIQEVVKVKVREMKVDAEANPNVVVVGREISVTVKAHIDGNPIEGVRVKLESELKSLSPLEGLTNKDGIFNAKFLVDKSGIKEIKLSAYKEGFTPFSSSLKVEGVTLGTPQEKPTTEVPLISTDLLLMILVVALLPLGLIIFRRRRRK
ncbi:hypothetical protein HRbin06_00976 [archaeon HR06]|nr:hypothetical protein HRbin06_00976 [archaeon HR06]